MKHFNSLAAVVLVSLPFTAAAQGSVPPVSPPAQAADAPGGEVVAIRLKDGSLLRARIIDEHRAFPGEVVGEERANFRPFLG